MFLSESSYIMLVNLNLATKSPNSCSPDLIANIDTFLIKLFCIVILNLLKYSGDSMTVLLIS